MKKVTKEEFNDDIKIIKKYKNLDVNKKILICLYIIIILMLINIIIPYITLFIQNKMSSNNQVKYDTSKFKKITGNGVSNVGKDKKELLFICSENYQECHDFIGTIQKAQDEYNYITNYLEAEELNSEQVKEDLVKFDNENGFINSSLGQIPIILVLQNGKLVEGWVGVSSYDNFKEFLTKAGMIK